MILDQQFVAHLYLPADGPHAEAAQRAVTEIWRGCAAVLHLTEPVAGTCLPGLPPDSPQGLPADGESAVAALQHPAGHSQVILRRHHDLLVLSVALAPPEAVRPRDGVVSVPWLWWRTLDYQWDALVRAHLPVSVGESRIYLARVEAREQSAVADPELYRTLGEVLPASARRPAGRHDRGVALADGLALWEDLPEPDERALRRFVLAVRDDADPVASALAWSDGSTAMPPLARYLLHAAKIRYQLRIWQRDGQARLLRDSVDRLTAELRTAGPSGRAEAELLRLCRLDALLLRSDLKDMRRTVEIAADNMGRALDLAGPAGRSGPFADDSGLAESFVERLEDEVAYLAEAAERAGLAAASVPVLPGAGAQDRPARPPVTGRAPDVPLPDVPAAGLPYGGPDASRNVFVVYGRDEPVRCAVFDFLRALGLNPLEWEELVALTGKATPTLGEAVARALPLAGAVVVLLTPDDVVGLHPDLHEPRESRAEKGPSLQARPNVLLELGMALAVHPARTLILQFGDMRPVTDLGGLNYIRVTDSPGFRSKVANRLALLGCPVKAGQDWLAAGDFGALTAYDRDPSPLLPPGGEADRKHAGSTEPVSQEAPPPV
ncbi:CATRA conflict system CASPASE/TPR repeat-associated protein [Streptomyces erythrochromogenes]|uniref:CATRA conflict system CASPASE/TPR repeat-associated protein n=1 Tax=Streptomyces erythrochromogenes TaxID=285574 RepID=UPI00369B64DF